MARTRTASKPSTVDLAKAVLKALQPGDGRVYPCPRNELPDRLAEDGVADLSAWTMRWPGCGMSGRSS